MSTLSFSEAVKAAVCDEMGADPSVVMLGEDIAHHGGMFQVTKGILERFGNQRVIDTPISESGFIGMALGLALTGCKPVVELMFVDFSLVAMDQILNQVAKTTFMSGGLPVPIVIRTQGGGYKGAAAQHSQMLETLFLHVPGLKVVAPSNPSDAYHMLREAIQDPNPVVFIEHKQLYPVTEEMKNGAQRPQRAVVTRQGESLTIASYSYTHIQCLEAAQALAPDVSAEVIDLRYLNPLDLETVAQSVKKTHRLLVCHESHARCGVGADLAAQVQEACFDDLDAPIARVTGLDVPVPFAKNLEDAVLPSPEKIAEAARRLVLA